MSEMKETKEIMTFVFALIEAGYKAMDDGEVTFTDAYHLIAPLQKFGDAVDDAAKAVLEMESVDEAKVAELKAWANETFDIPDDKIELYVEKGISVGLALLEAWNSLRGKE